LDMAFRFFLDMVMFVMIGNLNGLVSNSKVIGAGLLHAQCSREQMLFATCHHRGRRMYLVLLYALFQSWANIYAPLPFQRILKTKSDESYLKDYVLYNLEHLHISTRGPSPRFLQDLDFI
jgi:hypothetical protein